jgi:hypothetical protein
MRSDCGAEPRRPLDRQSLATPVLSGRPLQSFSFTES